MECVHRSASQYVESVRMCSAGVPWRRYPIFGTPESEVEEAHSQEGSSGVGLLPPLTHWAKSSAKPLYCREGQCYDGGWLSCLLKLPTHVTTCKTSMLPIAYAAAGPSQDPLKESEQWCQQKGIMGNQSTHMETAPVRRVRGSNWRGGVHFAWRWVLKSQLLKLFY